MFNELNAGNGPEKRREQQKNEEARPLADREVPIQRETMSATVHGWLDGELPEAAVRSKGFDRQVELWKAVSADLEVRRRVATPAGAMERIMAACGRVPLLYLRSKRSTPRFFLSRAIFAATVSGDPT